MADEAGDGPELVPQPHGGALYRGGVRGNKGGGRPSNEIRKLHQESAGVAAEVINARILEIAKAVKASKRRGRKPPPQVNWKQFADMAEMAHKYGLGTKQETLVLTADGLKMLEIVFEVLSEVCSAELYEDLSEAIIARAEAIDG